jgi:hypothetical protein
VDELATLFEPRVDGLPRHVDVTGRLGDGFVGERAHLVLREGVAERMTGAVHHQRVLRVEHRGSVHQRLNPARMGFDEDDVDG